MSLQVWLPLNGNLNNNGINKTNVIGTNLTVDAMGKIGKCYISANNTYIDSGYGNGKVLDNLSICCWFKFTTVQTSKIAFGSPNGSSQRCYLGYTGGQWCIAYGGTAWSTGNGSAPGAVAGVWQHLAVVIKNKVMSLYIDGIKTGQQITLSTAPTAAGNIFALDYGAGTSYRPAGSMNDFRIYDHCLSEKEISEISKGLVINYPLRDINVQALDNCYSYPTFNTSSSSGGWSHWGRTGASGNYGQTTDKNYIFNKSNTYAHWWSNASTATGEYLLYQSPEYSGGVRSLQCILKEENSLPITESIVFPAWNARSGGAASDIWTLISNLGNGFYLCKCEGIMQDGSNDLVGLYVKPGYKVYISCAYLENYKEICSDIFNYNSEYAYDCSGYNYNGNITGSLTLKKDSPRNEISTVFTNGSYISFPNVSGSENLLDEFTLVGWIKRDYTDATVRIYFRGPVEAYINNDFKFRIRWIAQKEDGTYSSNTWAPGVLLPNNEWHHFAYTFKNSTFKFYFDGEYKIHSDRSPYIRGYYNNSEGLIGNTFIGQLSDIKYYTTALSDEDIKLLYEAPVSITNNGSLMTQGEIIEE